MAFRSVNRLLISTSLVAALLITNTAAADSATAQKFFENGNTAFRQGRYEAALENYSDALANGKDGSRLFYNMGLAHYRLGQYSQAKSDFHESSKDVKLAALSYYQLGVLAENDGKLRDAADWFTRARNNAESDRLRQKSEEALAIVNKPRSTDAGPSFESVLSVGLGYDSNAFRSPDTPYIDLSRTPPPLVVPVPQSSAYVPVRIKAAYSNPVSNVSTFVASYRLRGSYHADTAAQNANESSHRLSVGGERRIGDGRSRNRRIAYAAIYRMHSEINFDRDDGLDRFDDGQSIADRYKYQSLGAEADLKNRIGTMRVGLNGGWEQRDYEDLPTASSYDMTRYWIGGDVKIPLSDNARLKFAYEYQNRDYDERRSRDSTGDASFAHPTIVYHYNIFEAGLRHRFNERFIAELIYYYTLRTDEFVGYNDYNMNKFRLKATIDFTDRLETSIEITYRDQQYPNAFAFDNPTQASKEYQEFEVAIVADYRLTDRLSLRADFKQEFIQSSDPRGEYDRTRAAVGFAWDF